MKAEIRRENIKPFLNKIYQRLLKITTPKKQMENNSRAINVDVHRQDGNRTNDNDIIDHQTKVQTSRNHEFISVMRKQICEFAEHVQRAKAQYAAIYTLKENLTQGHAMIQMDFAENCACTSAGQVQSTYWNSSVVTLHPVVTYFKDESNTLQHKNFAYVSDELGHNFGTVYSFVKDIVKEIKGTVENLEMVHYWTDSPISRYRNKTAFYVISDHKHLLGIPAVWNYFETGHGKGPCDGIGGASKRTADLAIRQGKITVQDAPDHFEKVHHDN